MLFECNFFIGLFVIQQRYLQLKTLKIKLVKDACYLKFKMFKIFFTQTYSYKLVLYQLTWQQLTVRYRKTALGFLWTLLNPLINMTVIAVVFSMVMRLPLKEFIVFYFSGAIAYNLFSNTISSGANTLISSEALLKKIYVPKQIFVLSNSLSLLIDGLISACSLLLILYFLGVNFGPTLILMPVAFFLLFLFCFGLSLMLSVLSVYFRDIPNILTHLLAIGFYLTPILYPLEKMPSNFQAIMRFNPLYYFVKLFRSIVYEQAIPSVQLILLVISMSVITFLVGLVFFQKTQANTIYRL